MSPSRDNRFVEEVLAEKFIWSLKHASESKVADPENMINYSACGWLHHGHGVPYRTLGIMYNLIGRGFGVMDADWITNMHFAMEMTIMEDCG
jgi:hypothetical protein